MKIVNKVFNGLYCLLFQHLKKNQHLRHCIQFSPHLKPGLVHLTGKFPKELRAKVKDGIISETKFLGTISVDRHILIRQQTLLLFVSYKWCWEAAYFNSYRGGLPETHNIRWTL